MAPVYVVYILILVYVLMIKKKNQKLCGGSGPPPPPAAVPPTGLENPLPDTRINSAILAESSSALPLVRSSAYIRQRNDYKTRKF